MVQATLANRPNRQTIQANRIIDNLTTTRDTPQLRPAARLRESQLWWALARCPVDHKLGAVHLFPIQVRCYREPSLCRRTIEACLLHMRSRHFQAHLQLHCCSNTTADGIVQSFTKQFRWDNQLFESFSRYSPEHAPVSTMSSSVRHRVQG